MPRFTGCLIGFQCWFVASSTGSKCGKSKAIDGQYLLNVRRCEVRWFKGNIVAERPHFVVVGTLAVT